MAKKTTYEKLSELSREVTTWYSISNLASWDLETYMPKDAIEFRSSQTSLIQAHAHKLKTSSKFKKLLSSLIDLESGSFYDTTLSEPQKSALRAWRRDFLIASKLPSSLVKNLVTTSTKSIGVWSEARKTSQFKKFSPYLEKIIKLNQKKAHYLGFKESPYDALLDLYEPGATSKELIPLFEALKTGLKDLLQKIMQAETPDDRLLKGSFDPKIQFEFGKEILKAMGFTPEDSRLDLTSHPLCYTLNPNDIRMSTRIIEEDVMSNIFSVLHEGGHGLYGKNLPSSTYGTPLSEQVSLGMDESQSRFWETRIGRSRPFWKYFLPKLQERFPQLQSMTLDQFYPAINIVKPSHIRVEADEVTYSLHVILRFELEKMLIEGSANVKDVPELWNHKTQELLGILPPTDALGCLQDIHWSADYVGYFPTYVLGNLYAAQFFEKFASDHPDWEARVSSGDLLFIADWLKTHIHQYGRQYTTQELIQKVTGKPLSTKPYLDYLNNKFQQIYQY